ncbi:sensor domain-containing protein [Mycobacterium intracellulare]|uniref:Sensor domain-containing protein n=2 Tax=Mycobacteriaceae TaxID=1762 RepID=A0A7R7RP20_MYCIT|nr:sensor domain-containing protein [Mycobacterium intracellulare]BCP38428.1 sensor domain-containing protein [Mycobacterium intracellulare M.i.198]BCO58610.1 sensor domain-containing protein [Mycobacterium intracellulare]BCO63868.1 sensor domain-containing protein [Mycobacterium intracellulare]BCO69181.1 sensor domain-containing protein [Mycobacterium intracellulare]
MSQRTKWARLPLWCGAVLMAVSCTRVVDGAALAGPDTNRRVVQGINVDTILLDQSRMRAITGAGEHLTIIPSMDGTSPVNIDALAQTAPRECRFIYDETATFGTDLEAFHKTTFQDPPDGALISEGAAAYRDAEIARTAFNALVGTVGDCANGSGGQLYVGEWNADGTSLHLRPGGCGRDYRILSVAMLEVTFCGFAQSVSDIVMTNIAANVPR